MALTDAVTSGDRALREDASTKIAIGPVLFGWPEKRLRSFWREMAALPEVDILYIGEVVCVKRSISGVEWLLGLAAELADSGKEIVLSTLAMPTTEAELQAIRELVAAAGAMGLTIEANDMAAVAIAAENGAGFVAGPHLNIYNHGTLEELCRLGARRVVLPLEMPSRDITGVVGPSGIQVEYFAHGKLPLTFSARCYAARAEGLSKRNCQHVCFAHPDGIRMRTLEGADFATINGIQMMSDRPFTALRHLASIQQAGVHVLRLSPQPSHMRDVVAQFHAVMNAAVPAEDALGALARGRAPADVFCNGYYFGRQGRLWIEE